MVGTLTTLAFDKCIRGVYTRGFKKMTRTKTLPNHREGIREVMLDSEGKVLPVISATRISYTPDRVTTYQRPEINGFVVRCLNDKGIPKITLNRYMPHLDLITPVVGDIDLTHKILSKIDPQLIAWLKDVVTGIQPNLLPAGFGWDGIMTATEYGKHERIRELFIAPNDWTEKESDWFNKLVVEAVRTSAIYLKLDWNDSFKIVNDTISIQRFLDQTKVYVVTFDKDGNRALHLVRRPICVGLKAAKIPEVFTVPKGTVRAILLRTNVMYDNNETYGVSIDLYKR